MKKALFVVKVDNYKQSICNLTIPTIKKYADKIKADYIEITERKFQDFPPTYEKLQVYELGKEYDWNILCDADLLIDENAPDFTIGLDPNYIGIFESFPASSMFELDNVFQSDKRNIGIASYFIITNKINHQLWKPLDLSWEEARLKTKREFIIDEYCLSRNLAEKKILFTGLLYSQEVATSFKHLSLNTR